MARVGRSTAALRLLALAALLVGGARAQPLAGGGSIISTVAGNGGEGGFSSGGGPGTSARLDFPTGVAVDGGGNLLIADYGNHRIWRLAAGTGVITTVADRPVLRLQRRRGARHECASVLSVWSGGGRQRKCDHRRLGQ